MPAVRQRQWTLEDVERLMDERDGYAPRYELVDGELLVTPAPSRRHQDIVGELYVLLRAGRLRGPRGERSDATPKRPGDPVVARCGSAISVVGQAHRITKRQFFQKHGVPEYWVVDGEAEAFEIWKPGDERAALIDDHLVWQPDARVPAFELDVRHFFASVADEEPPEPE